MLSVDCGHHTQRARLLAVSYNICLQLIEGARVPDETLLGVTDARSQGFVSQRQQLLQRVAHDELGSCRYVHALILCRGQAGRTPDRATVKKSKWPSIAGAAEVVHDREKAERLWPKPLKTSFRDGLKTPGLAIIAVRADTAEYWHAANSGSSSSSASARYAATTPTDSRRRSSVDL